MDQRPVDIDHSSAFERLAGPRVRSLLGLGRRPSPRSEVPEPIYLASAVHLPASAYRPDTSVDPAQSLEGDNDAETTYDEVLLKRSRPEEKLLMTYDVSFGHIPLLVCLKCQSIRITAHLFTSGSHAARRCL